MPHSQHACRRATDPIAIAGDERGSIRETQVSHVLLIAS